MYLDVYGQHFSLNGNWQDVLDRIGLDFAWFVQPAARGRLRGRRGDRSSSVRPTSTPSATVAATFVTPRNVVYQDGDRQGRGLLRARGLDRRPRDGHARRPGRGRPPRARGRLPLPPLAVGEHLEARGLTRLHALGLVGGAGRGRGDAAVGRRQEHAGAARAARRAASGSCPRTRPLLDRHGDLHPFPLRIGVNADRRRALPDGHASAGSSAWSSTRSWRSTWRRSPTASRRASAAAPSRHRPPLARPRRAARARSHAGRPWDAVPRGRGRRRRLPGHGVRAPARDARRSGQAQAGTDTLARLCCGAPERAGLASDVGPGPRAQLGSAPAAARERSQ